MRPDTRQTIIICNRPHNKVTSGCAVQVHRCRHVTFSAHHNEVFRVYRCNTRYCLPQHPTSNNIQLRQQRCTPSCNHPTMASSNATPYKIDVPDAAIHRLKDKLAVSDLPDVVDFSNDWAYGAPRDDVQRLAKYWQHGFDWRAQEAKLNAELPQFKTTVDVEGFGELNIHLVHKKSPRSGSIPLLFCHGCRSCPTQSRETIIIC